MCQLHESELNGAGSLHHCSQTFSLLEMCSNEKYLRLMVGFVTSCV